MNTTHDAVIADEALRQQRLVHARQFDAARNRVVHLQSTVARMTAELEPLRKQLVNLDHLDNLVGKLDGNMPGTGGGLARTQIILISVAARNWIAMRLAKDERELTAVTEQLAKAEQELASFE